MIALSSVRLAAADPAADPKALLAAGRAKGVNVTLRGQVDGDRRAIATRKVIACNHALKLPDDDGL